MANINLCRVPELDITYQNVIDFSTKAQQNTFFGNRLVKVVQGSVIADSARTEYTLQTSVDSINSVDYLWVESAGKRYYYFITSKEFKTSTSCVVRLELDVFSTYLFDFVLMTSFVERCHEDRWKYGKPTVNTIDEGLPLGEYEVIDEKFIYQLKRNFIMSSTSPLGKTGGDGGVLPPPPTGNMMDENGNHWFYPTTGSISASYPDYSNGYFHGGVDFANNVGTPIIAIADGVVRQVNYDTGGYGRHLVISHIGEDGVDYHVWYAHMNSFGSGIQVGATVLQGGYLGEMGSTGNSTGPHLHIEMRKPSYRSGSYGVSNGQPDYSVGDTIHPAVNLRVGDVVGLNSKARQEILNTVDITATDYYTKDMTEEEEE